MSNFKLVDGERVALSATEEQDLVESATQHAIDMTAYDAQLYARKRQAEYPSYATQLDEIYHNGIDSWKATIKVTKDKYPKG
jgi:hypothetical protein